MLTFFKINNNGNLTKNLVNQFKKKYKDFEKNLYIFKNYITKIKLKILQKNKI